MTDIGERLHYYQENPNVPDETLRAAAEIERLEDRLEMALAEIHRLRAALSYYADYNNYSYATGTPESFCDRARAALKDKQ
jgi:hypothetical protein